MKKKFIFIVSIIFLFTYIQSLQAQSGMRFPELAQRLEPYFAEELIADIKKQLPQGSEYTIWGWDVGDFSGDGNPDVAFTVKLAAERKRITQVYLFVDIDGFLTKVTQFPYEYVDMPLEIGVVIRYNICYITKKIKQFNWIIRGYVFDNGSLVLLDEFITNSIKKFTNEKYTNFQSLQNTEKYIITSDDEQKFFTSYITIPSYYRNRQIYKGYASEALSHYVDYVHKGAFYWSGDEDASFYVSSAFDEKYLYMTVKVKDDKVIVPNCDTCAADFVEVWFDLNPLEEGTERFSIKEIDKSAFTKKAEKGIFSFKIYPGDFKEKKAFLKGISSTDEIYNYQQEAVGRIKAVSSLDENGYTLKFKIPFEVFGFESPPLEDKKTSAMGCTVILHDNDNEFRPEEETQMATSIFKSSDPTTYGNLLLIPTNVWYGETMNIYRDEIIKYLQELGF